MSKGFGKFKSSRRLTDKRIGLMVNKPNSKMTDVFIPNHPNTNHSIMFQPKGTTDNDKDLYDDGYSVNSNGHQYSVYRSCGYPCGDCQNAWLSRPRHCEWYGLKYHGPNAEIPPNSFKITARSLLRPFRTLKRYFTR